MFCFIYWNLSVHPFTSPLIFQLQLKTLCHLYCFTDGTILWYFECFVDEVQCMLCYTTLCCAVLCYGMQCDVMISYDLFKCLCLPLPLLWNWIQSKLNKPDIISYTIHPNHLFTAYYDSKWSSVFFCTAYNEEKASTGRKTGEADDDGGLWIQTNRIDIVLECLLYSHAFAVLYCTYCTICVHAVWVI